MRMRHQMQTQVIHTRIVLVKFSIRSIIKQTLFILEPVFVFRRNFGILLPQKEIRVNFCNMRGKEIA